MTKYTVFVTGTKDMRSNDPAINQISKRLHWGNECSKQFTVQASNPSEAVGRVIAGVSNIILEDGATVNLPDGRNIPFNVNQVTPQKE